MGMADLGSFGLSTISSIIGGGLLVFAITTLYTDFYNQPFVNIHSNDTTVVVANDGVLF